MLRLVVAFHAKFRRQQSPTVRRQLAANHGALKAYAAKRLLTVRA